MATLTGEQKVFVVQRLACFASLSEIVEALNQEFKVTASPQAIQRYDPTKANCRANKELVKIFHETRKRFRENTDDIPIANRAYRLQTLQNMAVQALSRKNFALVAQLHEQAAKEIGEAYTNKHKHEVTGKDGGPVQYHKAETLTDDELAAIATGTGKQG